MVAQVEVAVEVVVQVQVEQEIHPLLLPLKVLVVVLGVVVVHHLLVAEAAVLQQSVQELGVHQQQILVELVQQLKFQVHLYNYLVVEAEVNIMQQLLRRVPQLVV